MDQPISEQGSSDLHDQIFEVALSIVPTFERCKIEENGADLVLLHTHTHMHTHKVTNYKASIECHFHLGFDRHVSGPPVVSMGTILQRSTAPSNRAHFTPRG